MLTTLDMPKEKTVPTVTMMVGTNDISRGKHRKITRLSDNFKRLIGDVRVGGFSGLDFSFLDEDEVETVGGKTEPAEDETFSLKAPSAFMNAIYEAALLARSKQQQSNS